MEFKITKVDVRNPIQDYHTVGQELTEIIRHKELNLAGLIKQLGLIQPFDSIKKFNKTQRGIIENFVGIEGFSEFLKNFQDNYSKKELITKPLYQQYKKVYGQFKQVEKYLKGYSFDGRDLLDDLVEFLGIEDELDSEAITKAMPSIAVKYRKPTKDTTPLNVLAFLRKGEFDYREASKNNDLVVYNKKDFLRWIESKSTWDNKLTDIDYIKTNLAQELKEFGVVLSLAESLPKSVFGATRWIENRPLIQVSDRERNLAVFWYTLFHEFGHMVLHEGQDMINEEGGLSRKEGQRQEKEANDFANKYLCNGADINGSVFRAKKANIDIDLDSISRQTGVHRMFFLYRMNKAQYFPRSAYRYEYNTYKLELSM